ncbi:MAG: hypothetical protein P8Q36_20530 [Alphaproteobacteria bacterium]|jgi:hypothetical protein|nr:hypothetical protein [Rhodospirillaceae bacterium]MBT7614069.1 hypothetical protein [Rhodospirillaceae bacterium]MBT7645614.1 hypothetical protein [Rhodospirillaceae bacterium]MDG2483231.1 hypothetical protein [Alphaproteobacteria bacterium]
MKVWLGGGAAILVLAVLVTWLIESIFASDGIQLGTHGTIAVFLCLLIIPALTMGLMRLAHESDAKGFDKAASEGFENQPADPKEP